MNNDEETQRDEIRRVLREAGRPLEARELVAASELFDGPASISVVLARMALEGDVEWSERSDGRRVYSLPVRPADPDAPTAKSGVGDRRRGRCSPDAVLAVLRERGPLSRQALAAASGCPAQRISDALTKLAHRGLAVHAGNRLWAAANPVTPSDAGANPAKPEQAKATPAKGDQARPVPAERADGESHAAPLIALRSDGVIEIRRTAAPWLEIEPEEMHALQQFVTDLRKVQS